MEPLVTGIPVSDLGPPVEAAAAPSTMLMLASSEPSPSTHAVVIVPPGVPPNGSFDVSINGLITTIRLTPNIQPGQPLLVPVPPRAYLPTRHPPPPSLMQAQPVASAPQPAGNAGVTTSGSGGGASHVRRRSRSPARSRQSHVEEQVERGAVLSSLDSVVAGTVQKLRDSTRARSTWFKPLTLTFNDETLEAKYRHEEFSRSYRLYLVNLSILSVLNFVAQPSYVIGSTAGAIMLTLCFVRHRFHHLPHDAWRLDGWVLCVSCAATAIAAVYWIYSRRANAMVVSQTEPMSLADAERYTLHCIVSILFYLIGAVLIFTDAAMPVQHRMLLSLLFFVATLPTGVPSPMLTTYMSVLTCTLGYAIGFVIGRLIERRGRDSFIHATTLSDSLVVWRMLAITDDGNEDDDEEEGDDDEGEGNDDGDDDDAEDDDA